MGPPNWLEQFVGGILQQARIVAREEYTQLLAERETAAAEADRNERTLTVREAAAKLNMREQTVYTWVKTGKLQAYNVGRAVRLKLGDVQAALTAHTQPDGRRKYARRAANNKKA